MSIKIIPISINFNNLNKILVTLFKYGVICISIGNILLKTNCKIFTIYFVLMR